jgi:methyl-accepting chemotaxis protein
MLQRFSIRFWLNVLGGGGLLAIAVLAVLGHQVVGRLVSSLEMSTEVAAALRNHLQADMMHDAIRGDVLLSLHESARANAAGIEEARKDLSEHVDDLVGRLQANAELALPDEVKARIAGAKPALDAYVAEAVTITGLAGSDPAEAERHFATFLEKFEALEEQMGEISDELKKFAGEIDEAGSSLARSAQWVITLVALAALLATMVISGLAAHSINGWIARMVACMGALARGEHLAAVPGLGRRDPLGAMASAIQVFSDNAERIRVLQAEQEKEREAARQAQIDALRSLADTVERDIRAAIERLAEQSSEVTANVDQMRESADRVSDNAQTVTSAAGEALRNTETVASAAEEMSASIREISTRLGEASGAIGSSVASSDRAAETISRLSSQVDRIGDVARLIADIAGQTNLLALNATIEAARAGDAGKGFAVVAGEVKNLASQTGRSTEDIARLTGEIRALTADAVRDVGAIAEEVKRVNDMTAAVAAAVEEQSAVTAEIARSVNQAAGSVRDVSGRIDAVSTEAAASGTRAVAVEAAVARSGEAIDQLRSLVVRALRTSDENVDRRQHERFNVDWAGELSWRGGSHRIALRDISAGGAYIKSDPALAEVNDGTLRFDGHGVPLPFRTVSHDGGLRVRFAFAAGEQARWSDWLSKRLGRAIAA